MVNGINVEVLLIVLKILVWYWLSVIIWFVELVFIE